MSEFDVGNKRVVNAKAAITDDNAVVLQQLLDHVNDFSNPHHVELGQISEPPSIYNLIKPQSIATIGGKLFIGTNSTILIEDLDDTQTTIDVRDQLNSGDIIVLQARNEIEFIQITSSGTAIQDGYRHTVTRNLDGSGANNWLFGDMILNTGTTNDSIIGLYTDTGLLSAHKGPTISGLFRTGTSYSNLTEYWALGNLEGTYGFGSSVYGLGLGKYSPSTPFITITDTDGIKFIYNSEVRGIWSSSGIIVGTPGVPSRSYVEIDSSGNLYLRTTTVGETTLTRVQLLNDGSGYIANGNINWSTLGVTKIANWTVESNYLHDDNNYIILQTGTGLTKTAGRIIIDGSVTGGAINIGSGITILGSGEGTITGGTIRTASSGSRIELSGANNSIDIYNPYTLSRIKYDDYGLIIDDDVNNIYTTYQQYFKFSNNGLNVYKRQSDSGWINFNFGKAVENSNGVIVRVWKENSVHSYVAESFSIVRTGFTTGWTIQWGTDSSDPDTNLYRSAANTLKTDDAFHVGGLLLTVASGTGLSGFRIPHGVAPTSPTNGDVWTTTSGIFVRVNGTTYQLATTAGGGGTVTSVGLTQTGSIFTITNTPITTSGNINIAWSVAQGDLLYASAANTMAKLAKSVTANSFLKNSGTSNNPQWSTISTSDISNLSSWGGSANITTVGDIIAGRTELTTGLASTDELLVSDSGVIKRMDIAVIESYMNLNVNQIHSGAMYVNFPSTGVLTLGDTYFASNSVVLTIDNNNRLFSFDEGTLVTETPVAARAGFRLPHGVAPTTPTNGDVWSTTTDLYIRLNGTTYSLLKNNWTGSSSLITVGDIITPFSAETSLSDADLFLLKDATLDPPMRKITALNMKSYFGGGSPGGSSGQIQFNNGSAFAGVVDLTWNNSTKVLHLGSNGNSVGKLEFSDAAGDTASIYMSAADYNLYLTTGNAGGFIVLDRPLTSTQKFKTNSIVEFDAGTTNADGIAWGTDVYVYRSGTGTLSLTGALIASSTIKATGGFISSSGSSGMSTSIAFYDRDGGYHEITIESGLIIGWDVS